MCNFYRFWRIIKSFPTYSTENECFWVLIFVRSWSKYESSTSDKESWDITVYFLLMEHIHELSAHHVRSLELALLPCGSKVAVGQVSHLMTSYWIKFLLNKKKLYCLNVWLRSIIISLWFFTYNLIIIIILKNKMLKTLRKCNPKSDNPFH